MSQPKLPSTALRLRRATLQARWFKPALFVLALLPLASLVWRAFALDLGANPEQTLIWSTGRWTLRLLLLTLAVTPLRQLTGWAELARLRRMLGLFAFSYALLHFSCYIWLVNDFDLDLVRQDVAKHPFVLAGLSALLLMLPLALTSTNAMIRRLGAARWQALHRLVYLVGVVGVFHAWWGRFAKHDTAEPKVYAAILLVLLGWRLLRKLQNTSNWSPASICSRVSRSRIRWARSPSTSTSAARGREL
jgi:sulfoxide reductase heme-binding subunit YedZ